MSRISPGTVIVVIFAVLFGLVGAYAVRNSLNRAPAAATPQPPAMTSVPVASLNLEPGRRIAMGDIAIMRLTAEQLQDQGFPDGYMTNPQQIIGRTLKDHQIKGKVFLTDQMYPEGVGPSISERLKPGLRAVTVEIANEAAVAGLAPPGSYVDVFFRTTKARTPDLPETTITLLEKVEVLALGPNVTPGIPSAAARAFAGNVTLAVTPEQASALKVVEGRGELMLALRSADDAELVTDSEPETLESLLGVVVEPEAPPTQTTIYRGVSNQTVLFKPEQTTNPIRITARPIRGRTALKTVVPLLEQPASRLESSTTEPDNPADAPQGTDSPTSALDTINAEGIARDSAAAALPTIVMTNPSDSRASTPRAATAGTATVQAAEAARIRELMAATGLRSSTPATTPIETTPPAAPAPVVAKAPVAPQAPVAPEPAAATPLSGALKKPLDAVSPVPATARPHTPTSISEKAATDLQLRDSESFRSVLFAGTQAETRVYENGELASRVFVPRPSRTVSDIEEENSASGSQR